MLLIPGAGFAIYTSLRRKQAALYYAFAWSLTLVLIYSVALPAIYHHGRYIMPLIPVITLLGVEGTTALFEKYHLKQRLQIITGLVIAGIVIALWIDGASTYALQVRLLTENHADVAHWLDEHAPKDAVIATHDIGLVGYITQRQIVDLAGLVTPEVIPIMDDQVKLADFVRNRNVTYLVVFTGYYTRLLDQLDAQLVYSPHREAMNALGLEPFEVFQIQTP
jgi:uncharacterized membrane protein